MSGCRILGRQRIRVSRPLLAAAVLLMVVVAPSMLGARNAAASKPGPVVTTWGGVGNDSANGIAVAGDGSVYLAGVTDSFGAGRTDAVLLKLSDKGRLVWQRTWGGNSTEAATGVAVGPDESVYVTGTTSSFGPGNPAFLLKFSAAGDLLWQRTWGGINVEFANGVAVAGDGSVYITGETLSFGSVREAFLVKFSAAGDLLWQEIWGGVLRDIATAVAVGSDGYVYVTGRTESFSSVYEVFLLKFAPDGTLVYQELWSRGKNDFATGIAVAGDGSVYITGAWMGGSELFLLKFGPGGNLIWQQLYNAIGTDAAQGVAVLADGSVFVAGFTDSSGEGLRDELVLKFAPTGDLVWQRTWGGTSADEGHGIAAQGTGAVAVAGLTWSASRFRVNTATGSVSALSGSVRVPAGVLNVPMGSVTIPAGTVRVPNGSTTFAGNYDATVFSMAS